MPRPGGGGVKRGLDHLGGRHDAVFKRPHLTAQSRALFSGDVSRQTYTPSVLYERIQRSSGAQDASKLPGRDKYSPMRSRLTQESEMLFAVTRSVAGSYIPAERFVNVFDPSALLNSPRYSQWPVSDEYDGKYQGKGATDMQRCIEHFINALKGCNLRPRDLNAFWLEDVSHETRLLVVQNWNIISALIYAPLYHKLCGHLDLSAHQKRNEANACAGAFGIGPIFMHKLDSRVQPYEIYRVDCAYSQFIVKYRPFVVHSVHGDQMYVIPVMGFGKKNKLPDPEDIQKQYAYLVRQDSTPIKNPATIPQIHYACKTPPSKQSYLHVARGVWVPLKLAVEWEGQIADEDLDIFAKAVGTVGDVTPEGLLHLHAQHKRAMEEKVHAAGSTPEKHKLREERHRQWILKAESETAAWKIAEKGKPAP